MCVAGVVNPVYSQEGSKEELSPGRANLILRDFFLERHRRLHSVAGGSTFKTLDPGNLGRWEGSREQYFLERDIDRQIDRFLEKLETRLDTVNAYYEEVLIARDQAMTAASQLDRTKAFTRWQKSLKHLSKEADRLRGYLSPVFIALKAKKHFQFSFSPDALKNGFQQEIDRIGEELDKAERQINDNFFSPVHTVGLNELRGEHVITHLKRVDKLSEQIRRALRCKNVGG